MKELTAGSREVFSAGLGSPAPRQARMPAATPLPRRRPAISISEFGFKPPVTGYTADASSDGQYVAMSINSLSGQVAVYRLADGALVRMFDGLGTAIYAIAFSPDGTLVAAGGNSNRVYICRISDGAVVANLPGHGTAVVALAFSPNGQYLASGDQSGFVASGKIVVWRVSDWSVARMWDLAAEGLLGRGVASLSFARDNDLLGLSIDFFNVFRTVSDGSTVSSG